MMYTIKTTEGTADVSFRCTHPDLNNNSAEHINCSGDCAACGYCVAETTGPAMMALIKASGAALA